MKVLKQILFAVAVMICFSITASAQNDGDKKPPKKENPPVIVIKDKEKPKDSDKPKEDKSNNDKKRPGFAYIKSSGEIELELV